jgi:uncharacterized protein (DUF1501 family)
MFSLSRRGFMIGCSAAIAAMAGARLSQVAFAASEATQGILIALFLRGGWDGLHVVPPLADVDGSSDRRRYEEARPSLRVPVSGQGAAFNLDGRFGLHPNLPRLYDLYRDGRLALIHAAGLVYDTRSHFAAQDYMEMGTPGAKSGTGWLARYLDTLALPVDAGQLPVLSMHPNPATALLGYPGAISLTDPGNFQIGGRARYAGHQVAALRQIYGSNAHWLDRAGSATLDTLQVVQARQWSNYVPANGALYPNDTRGFGRTLRTVAQLIKADLGLTAATIDLGGWDTHEYQRGPMEDLLTTLDAGLGAFYQDLDGCGAPGNRRGVTVVVMSEFGRRLQENGSIGTDHGHGSVMMVVGDQVQGGQLYGQWPGLAREQLYDGLDLAITTDYRRVLSEILTRQFGRTADQLGQIFPGYAQETPLGFVYPTLTASLPPDFSQPNHLFLPAVQRRALGC